MAPRAPQAALTPPRAATRSDSSADDARLVRAALDTLASTPSGRPLVDALQQSDITIEVLSNAQMQAQFGGAAGAFVPATQKLVVNREDLRDEPLWAAALIGHELRHMVDAPSRFEGISMFARNVPAAVGAALLAIPSLNNPVTAFVDRTHDGQLQTEVDAYAHQARIERELGITPNRIATHADGSPRTNDESLQVMRDHDGYALTGIRRAVIGGGTSMLGALTTVIVADSVQKMRGSALMPRPLAAAIVGASLIAPALDARAHWS